MECTDPNGCTLDSSELVERIAEWRAVSAEALSRTVEPEKITSIYPADAKLLRRLRDLIAAEAGCCAFLNFTIQEEDRHTIVELTFPEEAGSLVENVIGAPTSAPSP